VSYKKVKTIYLHIGVGKTGTTSIQKFLSEHHSTLLAAGTRYVMAGGGITGGGHQTIAKSCIREIPDYMVLEGDPKEDGTAILSELESNDQQTFVLSSENFPIADPLLVRQFFESNGHEYSFRIVLFVRSQDELLESEYNQFIKAKVETCTLEEYAESLFNGDFMRLAAYWGEVFGDENLLCRLYDAGHNVAIREFLGCLPITNRVSRALQSADNILLNKSLDASGFVNKYFENQRDSGIGEVTRAIEAKSIIGRGLPAVLMDSAAAARFRHKFRESNRLFSERYLGRCLVDLGGRRFSDQQREKYYRQWNHLLETEIFAQKSPLV
jgi:hypothetical protein